ncbi:hypothetical protein SOVF_165830 [Spinacia oleracea]|nr:hypothetical protein SOVF_165830 [Spinacia oleracea]
MASDQEEDEFLGFSDDEGHGVSTDSDSGDEVVDVEDDAVPLNSLQYGDMEQFQQVSDLNQLAQDFPNEDGKNIVGQQQTESANSQVVSHLFDLNTPQIEESGTSQDHQTTTPLNIGHHKPGKPRVAVGLKLEILIFLLGRKKPGLEKVIKGTIKEASIKFDYTPRTIGKIWNKARRQKEAMQTYDFSTNFHKCGRKIVEVPYESIVAIEMGDRTCIVDLAKMLNLGQTTV